MSVPARVFVVRLADPVIYARERFECVEGAEASTCVWRPLASFGPSAPPEGLRELL